MDWNLIGTLTASYTNTNYTAAVSTTPRVGATYFDRGTALKYIFLKNTGTTAIAASDCCTSLTVDPATFLVRATAGNSAVEPFAGTRVVGATSNATLEFGWFQIGGSTSITMDATGSTANQGVTIGATTVGAAVVMANTGVGAQASFGVAATTTAAAAAKVQIFKNVWGV